MLRSYGIIVEFGRFREKDTKCKLCHGIFTKYEEKETDVAIASKLLLLTHNDSSENYVIVSGDTDLVPAIKSARLMKPAIKIYSLFPCGRRNDELIGVSDGFFSMKAKKYQVHLLPGSVTLPNNRIIHKPASW